MKKYLLGLLSLAALLIGTTPASAEPISGAIGLTALIGSAFGISTAAGGAAAAIGGFLVSTVAGLVVSTGLSLLARSMQPKPKVGENLTGTETNIQIGGDVPRQIPMGICAMKGQLVFHNTMGVNNEFHQRAYVLGDWVCDSLLSVIIDGKKHTVTVNASDASSISYGVPDYAADLSLIFYRGTQLGANSDLVSLSNPSGRWDANSVLRGMCYVVVLFTYHAGSPLYENGIPEMSFELKGALLYDWRKDDTNGGSGGHRWNNVFTWEHTENPVVMAYNYQRGFYTNGERLIGMGMGDSDLILSTYTAAANACDELVPLDAGGSEPRYRAAMIVSADENLTHGQVLDQMQIAFAGYFIDYQGYYYCQAGVATAVSDTITDDELIIGEPVQVVRKRSRADLFNRVFGQYLDTEQVYGPESYGAQVDLGATTNDGEELGKSLDLLNVPSRTQAERIAKIKLREARLQGQAVITLGFDHVAKEVGDWITWDSATWGNRTYRIVNRVITPQRRVQLQLEEIISTAYSWGAADEAVAPANGITLTPGSRLSTVSVFAVAAITLTDGDGNILPALRFTWLPTTDPTIDAVVIEHRKVGTTGEGTKIVDYSPEDGFYQTTDNIVGATDYEARATIITTPARLTTWTAWVQTSIATAHLFYNVEAAVDAATAIPTGLTLSTGLDIAPGGAATAWVRADWNDLVSTNLSHYEVEAKEGAGSFIGFSTNTSQYIWRGFVPGTTVTVRVRGITKLGTQSGFSVEASIVAAVNTTPPSAITGLNATATFRGYSLRWINPPEADYHHAEIWEATVNNRASATQIAVVVGGNSFFRSELATGDTRYVWVRPVNSSGYAGVYTPPDATAGLAITTLSVISADVAAAAIDQTKFANNMQPVGVIANSSAAHTTGIDTALSTADGKLYRWTGSAWTAAVPAGDLTGQITSTQITDSAVTTPKLNAGAVTAGKVATDAISANELQANSVITAKIAAGAVNAAQISARAITADKLAVGSKNVAYNADFQIGVSGFAPAAGWNLVSGSPTLTVNGLGDANAIWSPAGYKNLQIFWSGAPSGTSLVSNRQQLQDSTASYYQVTANSWYELSACLSTHRCTARVYIEWFNGTSSVGTSVGAYVNGSQNSASGQPTWQDFSKSFVIAQAPASANRCILYVQTDYNSQSDPYTFVSGMYFGAAFSGQTAPSPYVDPGITLIGGGQIRTANIITEHMSVGTIDGDRITVNTLDAAKVKANTVLASSVTVGIGAGGTSPGGDTIATVATRAADPAVRINTGPATLITPGKIQIEGATTLVDWKQGGDLTKIAGGAISANTIEANKIKIGVRGLEIGGLQFTVQRDGSNNLTNNIAWSAGTITYINDTGGVSAVSIAAASGVTMSIGAVIYWLKGESILRLSSTPSGIISGADAIILMSYLGGGAINVTYGGTIIDGTQITTRSINADRITAASITATEVLQTAALITNTAAIDNLVVTNAKIDNLTLTNGKIGNGELTDLAYAVSASGGNTASVTKTIRTSEILVTANHSGRAGSLGVGMNFGQLLIGISGSAVFGVFNTWVRDGAGNHFLLSSSASYMFSGLSIGSSYQFDAWSTDNFSGGGVVNIVVQELVK